MQVLALFNSPVKYVDLNVTHDPKSGFMGMLANAYYRVAENTIFMRQLDPYIYLHELAHASGLPLRRKAIMDNLNAVFSNQDEDALEEIIAELTAYHLAMELNVPLYKNLDLVCNIILGKYHTAKQEALIKKAIPQAYEAYQYIMREWYVGSADKVA